MGISFLNWLQIYVVTDWLNPFMKFFTMIGEFGAVWVVLGLLLLCRKSTRRQGIYCLLAVMLSGIFCNLLLKPLVMRTRPFVINPQIELLLPPPADASFPSGHASASFAAATAMTGFSRVATICFYCLAVLISFSRMYFYLHFPGDILGGFVMGILLGLMAHYGGEFLIKRWRWLQERC
ncbi:MAG: phosphatase PAP2 family protein [Clostridiales bacterium]